MNDASAPVSLPVHSDEIEQLQHKIAAEHGYEITDHALVLYVRKKR